MHLCQCTEFAKEGFQRRPIGHQNLVKMVAGYPDREGKRSSLPRFPSHFQFRQQCLVDPLEQFGRKDQKAFT